MKLKNSLGIAILFSIGMLVNPVVAMAAPHFTLTPATGSQTVGQNFVVTMGIDSDIEKVIGVDIKASFDLTKLEVVSIEKGVIPADGYQFSFVPGQALIHNDTGTFEATLTPTNQSVLVGPIAKHELLKVTFKPKAVGTATFNYTCSAGSVVETNIISQAGVDVVDCASNQSGSYTITAGVGTTGAVAAATATPIATTSAKSALPQTGGVENTLFLMFFGISSIGAALYFKLV